jgi:hypothetical protein
MTGITPEGVNGAFDYEGLERFALIVPASGAAKE